MMNYPNFNVSLTNFPVKDSDTPPSDCTTINSDQTHSFVCNYLFFYWIMFTTASAGTKGWWKIVTSKILRQQKNWLPKNANKTRKEKTKQIN